MAFTYDITTDRGKTRLQLGDVDSTAYVFEDAEIDYFLTAGGDVDSATVIGLKTLLASKAQRVKKFALTGMSLDDTAQIAAIQALIETYGGNAPTLSAVDPARLPMDAGFDEVLL